MTYEPSEWKLEYKHLEGKDVLIKLDNGSIRGPLPLYFAGRNSVGHQVISIDKPTRYLFYVDDWTKIKIVNASKMNRDAFELSEKTIKEVKRRNKRPRIRRSG